MLTSINPLGERARGQNYWTTTAWYLIGSVLGGAAMGTIAGLVGQALPAGGWRVGVAAAAAFAGAILDWRGRKPPSIHRQVDENWLSRYRGWVYGLGFGAQLGFGVVTIVPTTAVYTYISIAILTGSPLAGAVMGATFGIVRGLGVLRVAGSKDPATLRSVMRRLQDGLAHARLGTVVAQGGAALLAVIVIFQ